MAKLSDSRIADRINRRIETNARFLRKWRAFSIGRRPIVKVYGLLRTGTNYLTRLIDLNFDVFCLTSLEEGWKHGPCNYNPHVRFIFAVKDPLSWLVSFKEWEEIHGRFSGESMAEFIATPVTHPELRNAWSCSDVVSVWNRSLASWLGHSSDRNVMFVRYEDILAGFEPELGRIGQTLALRQKTEELINLWSRADDWETPKPRKRRGIDYYRKQQYLEQFSESDLDSIRSKLDHELLARFAYRLP